MTLPAADAAFRQSLNARIAFTARQRGTGVQQLRREFLLQRFLARVFTDPDGPWLLMGGAGILVRLPGARHSQDVDLTRSDATVNQAVAELREVAARPAGDPFRFIVGGERVMTGGRSGVQLRVETYHQATLLDRFPVDLSTGVRLVASVDRVTPRPVVEIMGIDPPPTFTLYPLADQLADKVCAMFETHGVGRQPSTRFRDLVDILLVTQALRFDHADAVNALNAEATRRGLTLPAMLTRPSPGWTAGYRKVAQDSSLPPDLHDLEQALATAGRCINDLLNRQPTPGSWNPDEQRWTTTGR